MNLNSDSYSVQELIDLLGLNGTYSNVDIQNKKRVLEDQLKSRDDLGVEKQREILFFLDTALNRLSNIRQLTDSTSKNVDTLGTWAAQTNPVVQENSNFIIANQNTIAGKTADTTGGRYAITGEAPPGYINPINVRTTIQAINIDSRFRSEYYKTRSTDFSVRLPDVQKKVTGLRVGSIELPITYYAISRAQGNNTMLIIKNATGTEAWRVRLPDGNYEQSWTQQTYASHIESAMNNAIALAQGGAIDGNGVFTAGAPTPNLSPLKDICYTIDQTSGKSIFAVPYKKGGEPDPAGAFTAEGFTIRFNVDNDGNREMDTNIQLRLGWPLGFRVAQYVCGNNTVDPPTDENASAVSEGIVMCSGPRYAYLSIDDHQKNSGTSFIAAFANSSLDNNIITRLNLSAVMEGVGVYKSSNDPGLNNQLNRTREYFGPVDIARLTVRIYDEYGRVIDLNNMDWSFALSFEKLYD